MSPALARLLAGPIAHRGLHGCGLPGPVENSTSAARAAIEAGWGIECDVGLSRDGEAMVFHDDRLDRLTGASGLLVDHDAADLTTLPLRGGPDRIPTLAAFLATIDGRTPLVIEIKSALDGDMRLADRAMALVATYSGPVVLETFDPAIVRHCRAAPCPIGLVGPPEDGTPAEPAALEACDFVSWKIDRLAEITADRPGLPRTTWTVRSTAQQRTAIRQAAQIVFEGFAPLVR